MTFYTDGDGDGYGDPTTAQDCEPAGATGVSDNTDCDDTDATINPGITAPVIGDGLDQDCDGNDECYLDADQDGYGSATIVADNGEGCLYFYSRSVFSGDGDDLHGSITRFSNVAHGANAICGLGEVTGELSCWGGDGGFDATSVDDLARPVKDAPTVELGQIDGGLQFFCGVDKTGATLGTGAIECWGKDDIQGGHGVLPADTSQNFPTEDDFVSVSAGEKHACGLKSDGSITCWGDLTAAYTNTPTDMVYDQVAVGYDFSCARKSTDDTVICWGDGATVNLIDPFPSDSITTIEAMDDVVCGVNSSGAISCKSEAGTAPQESNIPAGLFNTVDVGQGFACALNTDGAAECWGEDDYDRVTNTPPAHITFDQLEVGTYSACGVRNSRVHCWGKSGAGQSTVDNDGDGYFGSGGDCLDGTDMEVINPGALEVCGDNIDNNCDGIGEVEVSVAVSGTPNLQDTLNDIDGDGTSNSTDTDHEPTLICLESGDYGSGTAVVIDDTVPPVHILGVGPGGTRVENQYSGSVFEIQNDDVILEGLTITGGDAVNGGGVYIDNASPTLRHLWITGNAATDGGGGIYIDGDLSDPSPTLQQLWIHDNDAYAGGGIQIWEAGDITMDHIRVENNRADRGGGIQWVRTDQLNATLEYLQVIGNTATDKGGALRIFSSEVGMAASIIDGNEGDKGGAAYVEKTSSVAVFNLFYSLVSHNTATTTGGIWQNPDSNVSGFHLGFHENSGENQSAGSGNHDYDTTTGTATYTVTYGGPNLNYDPPADTYDGHLRTDAPGRDIEGSWLPLDSDGSLLDLGAYGGWGGHLWDLDRDGSPEWWQPGDYDHSTYPALGWDCDDLDATKNSASGCAPP